MENASGVLDDMLSRQADIAIGAIRPKHILHKSFDFSFFYMSVSIGLTNKQILNNTTHGHIG